MIDNEPESESNESFSGDDVLSDDSKDNIDESRESVKIPLRMPRQMSIWNVTENT